MLLFWLDTDRDTNEGKFLRFREVSHHLARFPCQILICTLRKLESAKAAKPFLTPKNGSVIPFFDCYSVLCELHRNIGVSYHFMTCLFPLFQCHMVLQDRLEKEKGFAKNAVESYVYDMRGRLYDKLQKYITEEVTYCVMLQPSHRKHSKLFFFVLFQWSGITLKNEKGKKITRPIVHDWITYKLWAWVYYGLLTVDRNPCSFEHYQIVISPIIVVVSISERFSIECSKANTLSKCNHNHNGQSEEGKIPLWAYETSKYNKLNCLKRGWPSCE